MEKVDSTPIRLTEYSRASGCGCKIAPADLSEILSASGVQGSFDNLIIGHNEADDAAVFDWGDGSALISTTDFFLPIVDDPFDFGYIAAVNAISDVYAMGGTPMMAIAILGWPVEKLGKSLASKVLEGGRQACADHNIPLAGGHSVDMLEPLFGLSVSGRVDKANLKSNAGAQVGDNLYLSKPLGSGIIAAAAKRKIVQPADLEEAVKVMKKSNELGTEVAKLDGVNAMTDVTGFGLLGHLIEMCEASGVGASIEFDAVPQLSENRLKPYLDQFVMPDNTMRNFKAYSEKVSTLGGPQLLVLCDPQTSGGLLISSSAELDKLGYDCVRIGNVVEKSTPIVTLK